MHDFVDPQLPFGRWLAQRRKAYDYTQEQLACEVGYSVATIGKIEEGTRRPSRELAQLLVERLGVPEEEKSDILRLARQRAEPSSAGIRQER